MAGQKKLTHEQLKSFLEYVEAHIDAGGTCTHQNGVELFGIAKRLLEEQCTQGLTRVNMVLFCPACGCQHVDEPRADIHWTNPPHRSHKCADCDHIWRPADVCTNGVRSILTSGKDDSPRMIPHRAGVIDVETLQRFINVVHDNGCYECSRDMVKIARARWPRQDIRFVGE